VIVSFTFPVREIYVAARAMTRLVVIACLLSAGCARQPGGDARRIRLGFFPTVTHAVPLVMLERPSLQRALDGTHLDPKAFNAGPEAMEALLAGAIDACYLGPLPALNAHLRSNGRALVIVAGAASGGAAFVVRKGAGITGPESLHGKKLATPALGNTQDVALRTWLLAHGLRSNDLGGDVQVMPMASADILSLLRRGELDGAWVVEPWVSRLVHEAGAEVLLDERELWPNGELTTTVLVVTRALAADHPEVVQRLVQAHVDTVRFIDGHRDEARALVGRAILTRARKALPPEVLRDAFDRVQVTTRLQPETLDRLAADGRKLDYLPREGDPRAALDLHFLDAAR
jgi:NitT/TauT family transport system substrate-binding protein